MNTVYRPSLTNTETWLLQHALGLLAYAATDEAFAESFAHHIQAYNWYSLKISADATATQYVTPRTLTDSIRTTNWLLQQLDDRPEVTVARGLLATWADSYKQPKNLVLGIVGLAIIGPTLGILDTPKKKKTKMQIVIDRQLLATLSPEELVEQTHNISQAVLAKELRLARGKLEDLHPDTADWCMAGSGTKLYPATKAELAAIDDVADTLHYKIMNEADQVIALGISPSTQDSLVEDALN